MTPVILRDHCDARMGEAFIVGQEQWLGVWDLGQARILPPLSPKAELFAAMSLLLEFCMPYVAGKAFVRLWQGAAEVASAVALFATREGALRLVHGDLDCTTAAGFARPGEIIGLRYLCCARGRGDLVEFVNHDRGHKERLRLGVAHAARVDALFPRDAGFLQVCHVAAIANFHVASSDLPALGAEAILATTQGPVPVHALRPEMTLILTEGPPKPLRWIARRPRLCLGRMAPILLRAPYFGLAQDIVTTSATRIMRSGPAVEFLFGHERVLISAGDLTSSHGARYDRRLPVRDMYHLMLDDHACVAVDRCGVETALLADVITAEGGVTQRNLSQTDRTPCLPVLDKAAAQALIAASAKGRRGLL